MSNSGNWYDQTFLEYSLITEGLILAVAPNCKKPSLWADHLNWAMNEFEIYERDEISMFLAQVSHESGDFNRLEELLSYSAERLMQVWPSRFPTMEIAKKYARNPKGLANYVYGDRLGNRGSHTNDGWNYRGSGAIQLTGRANFADCSEGTDLPFLENPDLLRTDIESAAISACWFWKNRVSMGSISSVTRQINGGLNGIDDRKSRLTKAEKYARVDRELGGKGAQPEL